jgi:hypothetical protein
MMPNSPFNQATHPATQTATPSPTATNAPISRSDTLNTFPQTSTVSPSPTIGSDNTHAQKEGALQRWERAEERETVGPLAEGGRIHDGPRGAEIKLSQGRKWFLLLIFSVAQVCPSP